LARVWVDDHGHLRPVKITRGLDDGNNFEVLSGNLNEGDQVVTDRMRNEESTSSNPLAGSHGLHLHM